MKTTLKLEEIAMLGLGIYLFSLLSYPWWLFLALFLLPDIGMLGYIINNRVGALSYNTFHHKGIAVLIYIIGVYISNELLLLSGIILFSHTAFDRILGYGLKYEKGFKFTHLGEIGKKD
ncbi:uncharacterized protein DUF4260 [Aquimarina sp. MAR_2010_214]|uniref:DUF4260 domain-containing protein n=1 Tax=Aquimarina sp. MAR_2010_214 TaxID=1250026 RepID=UPI000C70AB17|nr:DUF4260 domain-containing protein [Aquimarina sp. MAR_2010_214]PKV48208.1 uncharacterized protein DUF4260 [Aquimarina sp. MAR_2010_214]